MKRKVTDKYRTDVKMGTVALMPEEIQPMAEGIHILIQSVYDDNVLKDMFSDGHETKVKENPLNENFAKAEFQALWKQINKLYMFKNNPEEFISKVIKLIKEQKVTMIVEHISYNQIEGGYDSAIFTAEKSAQTFDKVFRANKAIQDYVFTDGAAEKSIERRFVEDLDAAQEVCVYAKLPKGFHIPTPVGNYSPDWAIAFYEGTVKYIFLWRKPRVLWRV